MVPPHPAPVPLPAHKARDSRIARVPCEDRFGVRMLRALKDEPGGLNGFQSLHVKLTANRVQPPAQRPPTETPCNRRVQILPNRPTAWRGSSWLAAHLRGVLIAVC